MEIIGHKFMVDFGMTKSLPHKAHTQVKRRFLHRRLAQYRL